LSISRQHLEDREAAEQDRNIFEKRYSEIVTQFHSLCHIDGFTSYSDISPEIITARVIIIIIYMGYVFVYSGCSSIQLFI
jgi:hypothetical protein